MGCIILNQERMVRLSEIVIKPYRPKEIREKQEEIKATQRLANFHFSINGVIDSKEISKIVKLKAELDILYINWFEGKIS